LWGKDLYVHLREVYQQNAAFTVMFISRDYSAKLWTSHERQSAQARAFSESREYILPVRFDDTEVPGLPPTIGYIDIRCKPPQQLCDLIVEKLTAAGLKEAAVPRHRLVNRDTPTPEEASFRATLFQDPALSLAVAPEQYRRLVNCWMKFIPTICRSTWLHSVTDWIGCWRAGRSAISYWCLGSGSTKGRHRCASSQLSGTYAHQRSSVSFQGVTGKSKQFRTVAGEWCAIRSARVIYSLQITKKPGNWSYQTRRRRRF
jgi:TIR domain